MMHLGKPQSFGISGTCKGQAWGKQGLCFVGNWWERKRQEKKGSDTNQNNGGGRLITQAKVWL
jgi:hypothetical protein